jgi:hypothetical protein
MDRKDDDVVLSGGNDVGPGHPTPAPTLEADTQMWRRTRRSDVAIIGMSGRFAGSAERI